VVGSGTYLLQKFDGEFCTLTWSKFQMPHHEFPSDLEYLPRYTLSLSEVTSSSEYAASNDRVITKWSIRNCMAGSVVD
jgi:hypothetical protein